MPKIGLSRPYVAKYHEDGAGGVTYSDGVRAGRAVEYSLEVDTGDANNFYADNALAESVAGTFSGGTLTMTVAELEQPLSKLILGIKEQETEIDGQTVKELIYDDDAAAPYLGFGVIIKGMHNNATSWRAVVLRKVIFNVPTDSAATQEDEIDWQTDEIEATMMRDDTEKHMWKREATFATEAMADAYIRQMLNIPTNVDELTVVSVPGTDVGTTSLTVTPTLSDGRSYRYTTGTNVMLPQLHQDLSSWAVWDGASTIAAATGEKIIVAEVDTEGKALAAGSVVAEIRGE